MLAIRPAGKFGGVVGGHEAPDVGERVLVARGVGALVVVDGAIVHVEVVKAVGLVDGGLELLEDLVKAEEDLAFPFATSGGVDVAVVLGVHEDTAGGKELVLARVEAVFGPTCHVGESGDGIGEELEGGLGLPVIHFSEGLLAKHLDEKVCVGTVAAEFEVKLYGAEHTAWSVGNVELLLGVGVGRIRALAGVHCKVCGSVTTVIVVVGRLRGRDHSSVLAVPGPNTGPFVATIWVRNMDEVWVHSERCKGFIHFRGLVLDRTPHHFG